MKGTNASYAWARVEARINSSQESVWNALTLPEQTEKYMYNCQLHAQWIPGKRAVWKAKNAEGIWEDHVEAEVLVYQPKKHLAFKIMHQATKDYPAAVSELHFYLESDGEQVHLRIEQGDFTAIAHGLERSKSCQQGWEYVLPNLIKTCKTIT